jgi:uncharacterized repeat protein (TIGR03837 family)
MRWDVFCRVVDNLGDAGVCWRLAADLALRGEAVRLVIDDNTPLQRIAPQGARGVEVQQWSDAVAFDGADVVVEAFGCNPPTDFVAQMARAAAAPCWINLEYLSAEPYAERSHALPSPPLRGGGLTKFFFYPGFTPISGGLLREPGLLLTRAAFEREPWLQAMGCARRPHERVVVGFHYAHAGLDAWLTTLAQSPTLLLLPQGPAQAAVQAALGPALQRGALRAVLLPWLAQPDFDRLLWSADLNVVRGEDSLVRALWAGAPFVWQLYAQHDGAHQRKLQAFLQRWRADNPLTPAAAVGTLFEWWNGLGETTHAPPLPPLAPWGDAVRAWRERLAGQSDLATRLLGLVLAKR